MLVDLVVDTNVLLHASNPAEDRFNDAQAFLEVLLDSVAIMCVDKGYTLDTARNRSQIMAEYLTHLRAGTLGFQVVQTMAANERIRGVERHIEPREAKKIKQAVWDRTDRVFVKVTLNTEERTLVSHDFQHFPLDARDTLRTEIRVHILDCATCLPRLN